MTPPSTKTPAAPPTTARSRFRWIIVALLFAATVINYMDRQVLGLLKPDYLAKEFHWSELDFGRINMAFQAAYAVGQVLFGPLIDWVGTKGAYGAAILVWSFAAMGHAWVRSILGFDAARFTLGLGESGSFPTAIRTVTEWFPPRERSVATGIFNAGTNAGAMVAPLLVPWLAIRWGWRGAFVALGISGLIWLVFWLALFETPERSRRANAEERAYVLDGVPASAGAKVSWLKLLRYREAWGYYATCVLVGPVWWFYGFWLPDFFSKQFHLNLVHFGPPLAVIYTAAAFGSIAGGGLSAWFLRQGWSVNAARKTAALLCACATVPVMFSTRMPNAWLAAGLFALAGAAHQGWSATMYTAVADIFPKSAVASVVGLGGTLASVVSMGFFWLVSNLLQSEGNYREIMYLCGGAYVLAWILFQLAVPVIRPARID